MAQAGRRPQRAEMHAAQTEFSRQRAGARQRARAALLAGANTVLVAMARTVGATRNAPKRTRRKLNFLGNERAHATTASEGGTFGGRKHCFCRDGVQIL
jgi:hypothetical protein